MPDKKKLTRSIYITTNISCNLRCIYCYEKDKQSQLTFDLNNAKRLLSSVLSSKTEKGTLINFHGGEPFIEFDKIRELCEWAWGQDFVEHYTFFATSNGTLVHNEIQHWLFEHRHQFIVGLSLDGTKEMHNRNRSNSFDLIDIDFFIKTWPRQGVKMTISPYTLNSLSDGIIYMHNIGFKDIRANLAEMMDWSNLELLPIYRREMRKLASYYKSHPEQERCSLFNVSFAAILTDEIRKWCGAGTEMEAIDVDGSSHPCHLFFESVCGKEKSDKAKKIDFSDSNSYISTACKPCRFLKLCPTCYGSNYIARGNIAERDMSLCEFTKIRIEEVAKFEYDRIVNDSTNVNDLRDEEKYRRMRILEAIAKLWL